MATTATASKKGVSAARTQGYNADAEPVMLRKRIGSTIFIVNVRFSNTSKETMQDKLLRLIQGSREIEDFVGRGGATEQSEVRENA